jgi:hypothetical protein
MYASPEAQTVLANYVLVTVTVVCVRVVWLWRSRLPTGREHRIKRRRAESHKYGYD